MTASQNLDRSGAKRESIDRASGACATWTQGVLAAAAAATTAAAVTTTTLGRAGSEVVTKIVKLQRHLAIAALVHIHVEGWAL